MFQLNDGLRILDFEVCLQDLTSVKRAQLRGQQQQSAKGAASIFEQAGTTAHRRLLADQEAEFDVL